MKFPTDLFRACRAMRKSVPNSSSEDRDSFFRALIHAALPEEVYRVCVGDSPPHSKEIPESLIRAVQRDPLMLGWAYQIWNEPERDASTWGISRRGESQAEQLDLSAATQIFTEEHMAGFLCNRLSRLGGLQRDVCDPACGTGHLLVEVFRFKQREDPSRSRESILEELSGFDVDASAVFLCRVILVAEAAQGPAGRCDVTRAWTIVSQQIREVPKPHGVLDRGLQLHPHASCARQFSCVLTNPPYLGRRKLTAEMRAFLDLEYPDCALDLCAACIERCVELVADGGCLGLVTHDKWLRLKGYRALRNGGRSFGGLYRKLSVDTLCELGDRAFDRRLGLHDGIGVVLFVARQEPPCSQQALTFASLAHIKEYDEKVAALCSLSVSDQAHAIKEHTVAQSLLAEDRLDCLFLESGGVPQALMSTSRRVCDVADVIIGLQTDDDRRFVRYHWEVEPDPARWRVHSKGGGYGRWFGLNRTVIDWREGRQAFASSPRAGMSASAWFEREGWVYSWFANGSLGVRFKEAGWSFGRAASTGVFCEDVRVIGFLNSRFCSLCARRLGAKAQLPEGVVRRLPIPDSLEELDVRLIEAAVHLKRTLTCLDLTDSTFDPRLPMSAADEVAVEALLRVVEGAIELQVSVLLGVVHELDQDNFFASHVGLYPSFVDPNADQLWDRIPPDFRYVRGLLEPYFAWSATHRRGQPADSHAVLEALSAPRGTKLSRGALPADGRVERWCQISGIHPFDLWVMMQGPAGADPHVHRTLHAQGLERQAYVAILGLMGHRWWSVPSKIPRRAAGLCRAEEIADFVSSRVDDSEFLAGVGLSIPDWLEAHLEAWQRRVFGATAPLCVVPGRRLAVMHRWDSPGGGAYRDVEPVTDTSAR